MTRFQLPAPTRAICAGAICLSIVGGMLVGHAWPLWTGRDVIMNATVDGTRVWAPGEYVRLSTAAAALTTGQPAGKDAVERTPVRALDPWVAPNPAERPNSINRQLRGKTIYVQLAPVADGQHVPVSVSLRPVKDALNLRGVVTWALTSGEMRVQYGIDAFYLQEGKAAEMERAFSEKRRVQMQVAIASSGRARIRNLIIDGVPVQ